MNIRKNNKNKELGSNRSRKTGKVFSGLMVGLLLISVLTGFVMMSSNANGTEEYTLNSTDEYALDFDGDDDYVETTTLGDFGSSMDSDFTVSIWTNSTDTSDDVSYLSTHVPDDTAFHLRRGLGDGDEFELYLRDENGDRIETYTQNGDALAADGEWHNIIARKTGNSADDLSLWMDGEEMTDTYYNQDESFENPADFTDELLIGARGGDYDRHIYAQLDDARIYDEALSSSEISDLASDRYHDVATSDLRAWWKMNEGENGTVDDGAYDVEDFSGNGHNGTVEGATWTTLDESDDGGDFAGGSGTEDDPYQIENWNHMDNVRDDLSAHYELVSNITEDTDGYDDYASDTANGDDGWNPIGDESTEFDGSFDGVNYTISDIYIDRGRDCVGLFGDNDGTISDVNVLNADVTNVDDSDETDGTGILAGKTGDGAVVEDCHVNGSVHGQKSTGGLIGASYLGESTDVKRCGADVDVVQENAQRNAGGLIGFQSGLSVVTDSYARGTVTSEESNVGGLVGSQGENDDDDGEIINSYSTVDVEYDGDGAVGEFVGKIQDHVTDCIALEDNDHPFVGDYVNGNNDVGRSTNATATDMQSSEIYTQTSLSGYDDLDEPWDFVGNPNDDTGSDDIWDIDDGYPFLVDVHDYDGFAGGDGSESDPYQIENWNHMDNVRDERDANFILMNDLDDGVVGYTGIGDDFIPIGEDDSDKVFTGTFDGQGYEIRDLKMDVDNEYASVFGHADDSNIKNLGLNDIEIISQHEKAGGFVGYQTDGCTVENSYLVNSHIENEESNDDVYRGVAGIGARLRTSEIRGCFVGDNYMYSTSNVVAGLTTSIETNDGTDKGISNSYSLDNELRGDEDVLTRVSGITGDLGEYDDPSYLDKSYTAIDEDLMDTPNNPGANFNLKANLIGYLRDDSEVTDSYFDGDINSLPAVDEDEGSGTTEDTTELSTSDMKGSEAETNLDALNFDETWTTVEEGVEIDGITPEADGYPILQDVNTTAQLESQNLTAHPSVSTEDTTEITSDSAKLEGELTDMGDYSELEVYFEYTNTSDGSLSSTDSMSLNSAGDTTTWQITSDAHYGQGSEVDEMSDIVDDDNDLDESDFAIHLGDVTDDGTDAQFSDFDSAMDGYDNDWTYILGNHDWAGGSPSWDVNYGVEIINGVRIIYISDETNNADTEIGSTQDDWLKDELDSDKDIPTVMMSHSPPITTQQVKDMDNIDGNCDFWDEWLKDSIDDYNIVSWIAGHNAHHGGDGGTIDIENGGYVNRTDGESLDGYPPNEYGFDMLGSNAVVGNKVEDCPGKRKYHYMEITDNGNGTSDITFKKRDPDTEEWLDNFGYDSNGEYTTTVSTSETTDGTMTTDPISMSDVGTFFDTVEDLDSDTEYEFRAVVQDTDGNQLDEGDTKTFTTEEEDTPNQLPEITSNDATANIPDFIDMNIPMSLNFDVSDPDGDTMTITVYDGSNDTVIKEFTDQSNGTFNPNWNGWKRWSSGSYYLEVSDGTDTVTSNTYSVDVPNPDASVSMESATATIQKHVNEWAKDRRNFTLDVDEQTNTTIQLYNLTADEEFKLYVDGELENNLTANDNGTIEFEWGNWSEHTFLVELADDDTSGGLGILTDDDNFLGIPNWITYIIIVIMIGFVAIVMIRR